MRILMVSMNSIHFQRWTDQLKNSGHEIFWFDINDGVTVPKLAWLKAYQGWKFKFKNFKKRYFIKRYLPWLYKQLEANPANAFERVLLEVKPDLVHSFVMYISCVPILEVMQRYKNIAWIYSSWGSDLYYFRNLPEYRANIIKVLPRINYMFTDCKRDVSIASELGFKGEVLGTFPGGGGFDYAVSGAFIKPIQERQSILIKGYQGRSGKCIEVLKALLLIEKELNAFKIIIFGADEEVEQFIANQFQTALQLQVYSKKQFLSHDRVLQLMGEALIYIGNSNSDGMPNTLLEAIAQGAFPIQSNPGGASAEVIQHGKNGLLIEDCEDINDIQNIVLQALTNSELIDKAFLINQSEIKPNYEIEFIRNQVLKAYNKIEAL